MNQSEYEALIRHQTYIERFGAGLANRVLELFDKKKLKDFVFEKRKKVRKKIEDLIAKEKKKAQKFIDSELYSMAKLELSFMEQLAKDFKDIGLTKSEINELISTVMEKPLVVNNVEVGSLFDSTFKRKEEISKTLNSMLVGDLVTDAEALASFNAMLKQFANGMKAANTTYAFSVANQIREDFYSKTKAVDRVVISAVLDGRTTPYCMAIDGTIFNKGEGVRPPFHTRCRTIAIPLLVGETEEEVKEMLSLRATINPGKEYEKGDNTKLRSTKAQVEKGLVKIGTGGNSKQSATSYAEFLHSQTKSEQGRQFIIDKLGKKKGERFIKLVNQGEDSKELLNELIFDTKAKDLDINGLKKRVKQ